MTPLPPTLLLILDGWGQAPAGPGNAVSLAHTPTLDALLTHPAQTTLACSGRAVGLPQGYMGNSEVGHMNIGAGRVVYQDMTRIDIAIEDGSFARNPVLASTLEASKKSGGTLHLMGLLSDGGVHSHNNHILALLKAASTAGVPVALHLFTDGRDTGPNSGAEFMRELLLHTGDNARIATICGRYYAMDRDKRWERTQKAWEAIVHGHGNDISDPVLALEQAYANGETDEFFTPSVVKGSAPAGIQDKDTVFFFNFRADRARQLAHCLHDESFLFFERGRMPRLAAFATMTPYETTLPMPAAFVRQDLSDGLGIVLSRLGKKQLRLAETEKYAHVTYFFNGGIEDPLPGEDRLLVPSPRDVATYDLRPQMSVAEVTDTLLKAWYEGNYDFIVCNFANLDMVGHTGKIPAAIQACEAVDACLARVIAAVQERKGRLVVTADHGNAEEMLTPNNTAHTAHSKNPVAFIVLDQGPPKRLRKGGKLGDIAPTLLHFWGLDTPQAMTGESLWEE